MVWVGSMRVGEITSLARPLQIAPFDRGLISRDFGHRFCSSRNAREPVRRLFNLTHGNSACNIVTLTCISEYIKDETTTVRYRVAARCGSRPLLTSSSVVRASDQFTKGRGSHLGLVCFTEFTFLLIFNIIYYTKQLITVFNSHVFLALKAPI